MRWRAPLPGSAHRNSTSHRLRVSSRVVLGALVSSPLLRSTPQRWAILGDDVGIGRIHPIVSFENFRWLDDIALARCYFFWIDCQLLFLIVRRLQENLKRKITHPILILNIFITEWTSSRRERNAVVHSFAAVIDRFPLSTASALAAAALEWMFLRFSYQSVTSVFSTAALVLYSK